MLDLIRRKKKSGLIKMVFWAIIATFVGTIFLVWGKGSDQTVANGSLAAKVGDTEIGFAEFQSVYSNLYSLYQNIYRDQFTPEMEKRLGLRRQALESLIDQALLAQEAERQGVRVSKKEIIEAIAATPAFQQGGVFDKERYIQVLNYQRITPEQFEASQRRQLLIEKIQAKLFDQVRITDEQVEAEYLKQGQKLNLEFLRFSPVVFAARVEADEESLKAYFEQHLENFRIPEKVSLRYLQFDPQRYLEKVSLEQEELERYYRRHLIDYEVPEQVSVSHILIRVPEDAPEEEKALKKEHAENLLSQIAEGKDFAELATTHSDDPGSAAAGGKLPLFPRGTMVPAFEEAAFNLKPGEIGELVETPFGFHILKGEMYVEAGIRSIAEVMEEVKSGLRREKARQMAMEAAMDAYNINRKSGDLESAAEQSDLGIKETGLFTREGAIDGLPDTPEIKEAAFSLEPGELARPVTTEAGIILMALKERQSSRLPELDEVRTRVAQAYADSRAEELAGEAAEQALEKIKQGEADFAAIEGVKAEETGFFSRSYGDFVPRVGASRELFDLAFDLSPESALIPKVLLVGQDYFVVRLKQSEQADPAELTRSRREEIRNRLVSAREEELLQTKLEELRKQTAIEIQPSMNNYLF